MIRNNDEKTAWPPEQYCIIYQSSYQVSKSSYSYRISVESWNECYTSYEVDNLGEQIDFSLGNPLKVSVIIRHTTGISDVLYAKFFSTIATVFTFLCTKSHKGATRCLNRHLA